MSRARDTANQINRVNSSAADATAITVDSSENVGIGTSSPSSYYSTDLVVTVPDEGGITLVNDTTHTSYLMFADGTSGADRYRGQLSYDHNVNEMAFATNGNERMRILSGGGITFNGDTAAANALDDYEEGTFNTTVTTGGGSVTSNSRTLNYTKVGSLVTLHGQLTFSGVSNATGFINITLPFTPNNTPVPVGSIIFESSASKSSNSFGFYVRSDLGTARIYLADVSATDSSGANAQQITTSSQLKISIAYKV